MAEFCQKDVIIFLKSQNKSRPRQAIENVQSTVLAHDICGEPGMHWSKPSQFTDLIPVAIKLPRSVRH